MTAKQQKALHNCICNRTHGSRNWSLNSLVMQVYLHSATDIRILYVFFVSGLNQKHIHISLLKETAKIMIMTEIQTT